MRGLCILVLALAAQHAAAQNAETTPGSSPLTTPASTQQTHTHTHTHPMSGFVTVSCCEIHELLSGYLVLPTGDKLHKNVCLGTADPCLSLKLVKQFVERTRTMLDEAALDAPAALGQSMRTDDTHMQISESALAQVVSKMLVLAFLGRSVATEDGLRDGLSLAYDSTLDVLSVRDSACAVDKTIYSTIVVASISLLVFFIAIQVVESEKRIRLQALAARTVTPPQRAQQLAKHSLLRLRPYF